MRVLDYLIYFVALALYLPRLALFWLYRVLLFISKPGSLYILPALLGGLFYWQYDLITRSWPFDWWVHDVVMRFLPHYPYLEPFWYLGGFWALLTVSLVILTGGKTQILGTVLSALPQMHRPFPPTLRLRLIEKKIVPAKVALAVPALKGRPKGRRAPDMTAGLSEPLQRLLAPPMAMPPPKEPNNPVSSPESLEEEGNPPEPQQAEVEAVMACPSRRPPPPPLPPKAEI